VRDPSATDRGGGRLPGRRLHRGGDRAAGPGRAAGRPADGGHGRRHRERRVRRRRAGRAGRGARRADRGRGRRRGDVFIADTANCRVRVVPARGVTLFGQAMASGHLYTVAGTGVCGTAGQGGPVGTAQLWDPVAVAVDGAGDLLVADSGDQSVLLAACRAGTTTARRSARATSASSWAGRGLRAVSRRRARRHRTDGGAERPPRPRRRPHRHAVRDDGFLHAIRVVPASTGTLLGRVMSGGDLYTVAGAVPVQSAAGPGTGRAGCWRSWGRRRDRGVAVWCRRLQRRHPRRRAGHRGGMT